MVKAPIKTILVDARPLLTPTGTGVSVYAHELLNQLAFDASIRVILFAPLFRNKHALPKHLTRRFSVVSPRISSKWLKFLFFFKVRTIESYTTEHIDVIWMPNHDLIHTRLPITLTVHDLSPSITPQFFPIVHRVLWRLSMKRLTKRAKRFIAVSESTKRDLATLFHIPLSNIFVTPLSAGSGFTHASQPSDRSYLRHYPTDFPYFLYLGTLEPRKNITSLIEAFTSLKQTLGIPHRLLLVGKWGWRSGAIRKSWRTSLAHKDIIPLGYINAKERSALYRSAEAFIFPSFYEGFGLPILEAMKCGVPVIHSAIRPHLEVTGGAGIAIDPFNVNDIEQAMKLLIENKELKERCRAQGLERAKQFSWAITAEKTVRALLS